MATETQRRRASVGVYCARRADALSDPTLTPLKRARLTYGPGGHGVTTRALSVMAQLSEATVWRAETASDPRDVSPRTWRKLARALGTTVAVIQP
jgi:hypothetical protein